MTDTTAVDVATGTEDKASEHSIGTFVPGHEESTTLEDKKEEFLEILEDDWASDPENARNWPAYQRWVAVSIVR